MNRPALIPAALAVALGAFGAVQAHAEGPPVSFSITVGNAPPAYAPAPVYAPPPVVVAPQAMVWLPEVGAYVALGMQQPMFYLGGVYYYHYRGAWFTGPGYGGPWRPGVPPGALRRFRDPDWGRYQRMAHDYQGRHGWRQFRPGPAHGMPRRGPERGPAYGHGPEHGPGPQHGRGPDHGPDHDHGPGPGQGPGYGH